MTDTPPCPGCRSAFAYPTGMSLMCPECGHEWNPAGVEAENAPTQIRDANGNVLKDGDDVVIVKDLPVKGAPKALKAGTRVRDIRLKEGDHNIDRKIEGSGAMALRE